MFSIYSGKNNLVGDFPSCNFVPFVVDFKIVNHREHNGAERKTYWKGSSNSVASLGACASRS
jgi:hypothetical protein